MYPSVTDVKPLADYCLELEFDHQEKRIFDVKPYLDFGQFKTLRDINLFNSVRVCFDSIEWANQLDLDPEMLYEKSISV